MFALSSGLSLAAGQSEVPAQGLYEGVWSDLWHCIANASAGTAPSSTTSRLYAAGWDSLAQTGVLDQARHITVVQSEAAEFFATQFLNLGVCALVCVHACMSVCMHACMSVCMHACMSVCDLEVRSRDVSHRRDDFANEVSHRHHMPHASQPAQHASACVQREFPQCTNRESFRLEAWSFKGSVCDGDSDSAGVAGDCGGALTATLTTPPEQSNDGVQMLRLAIVLQNQLRILSVKQAGSACIALIA